MSDESFLGRVFDSYQNMTQIAACIREVGRSERSNVRAGSSSGAATPVSSSTFRKRTSPVEAAPAACRSVSKRETSRGARPPHLRGAATSTDPSVKRVGRLTHRLLGSRGAADRS